MKKASDYFVAAAVALIAVAPVASFAQSPTDWRFQATLYGYFPTIGGRTTFPPSGGSGSASVDIDSILDNLKFSFMGSFEAHKGRWGAFTDLVYLDVGNSKSGSRSLAIGGVVPANATATLDYDLKGWAWTLAGTYRAVSTPDYAMDVLAGARVLDITQKLGWQFSGDVGSIASADRSGNRETGGQNWDAIVGAKGRYAFGEGRKWFVPYYADVGFGESKFTWQAMGGLGYSFGWGDIVAAWRYLDYEMKSGKSMEELNFNGPAIAAVFRW